MSTNSISQDLYSLILTTAILTMILTPLVSSQTARLYAIKKRLFKHEPLETLNIPEAGLNRHAVIVGAGRVGSRITSVFKSFGLPLVVIELDHRRVQSVQTEGIPVVYGDATNEVVLEAAEIGAARLLVLTSPDIVTARAIINNARRKNRQLNVVARTSDSTFLPIFKEMHVSSVVLPEFETSLEMTRKSLLHFPIPITEIQQRTESLRQDLFAPFFDDGKGYRTLAQLRSAEQHFDLRWVLLQDGSPLVTRSIGGVEIRKKAGASVVGVIRNEKLIVNPDAMFRFQANDMVAIIGTNEARETFAAMSTPISKPVQKEKTT